MHEPGLYASVAAVNILHVRGSLWDYGCVRLTVLLPACLK